MPLSGEEDYLKMLQLAGSDERNMEHERVLPFISPLSGISAFLKCKHFGLSFVQKEADGGKHPRSLFKNVNMFLPHTMTYYSVHHLQ